MPKFVKKILSGKVLFILLLAGCGLVSFAASFLLTQKMVLTEEQEEPLAEEGPTADQTLLNSLAAAEGRRLQPGEQELSQLVKDVRLRLQQLERRQRELDDRERRLAMAADQLQRQAEDLEKLRVELAAAYTPLKESRAKLMKERTLIRNQELLNVQNTAKMWAKMDPANCARLVVEMFQNNQAEAATKIIHFLPEKNWAAIMDEIQELGPAVDVIIRQLRVVKEQPTS
jgi:septal ring factor EnvC (AmiA/AmiB activator)